MSTLSIIIPAWNEEDGIKEIMSRVLDTRSNLAKAGMDGLELIVVDDGSSDVTADIVRSEPEARLIQHSHNSGYGAALKTGWAAANGDWIGFLDADGTYPPEHFPELCRYALEYDADIVIGSRMAGEESGMPKIRKLGNIIFANLVSLVSVQKITDSASGMRVFKRSILPRIYPLPDGLNLTPVMSTRALHEKLTMLEVPIPYSERVGRSKLSVVNDGMLFAQSIVWTAMHYNPVRILGMIGLAGVLIAALIGLGLVITRLSGVQTIGVLGASLLFAALVSGVAGMSFLSLGTSFNYYVALFHKTPVKQGLFGRPLLPLSIVQQFGLIGSVTFVLGIGLGVVSLLLGFMGWPVERLWIYYLVSASFALIGIQLTITWIQIQVLDALRIREDLVQEDMNGKTTLPADEFSPQSLPAETVSGRI